MRESLVEVAGRLASAVLHDRRLARAPLTAYRLGLGRLLGPRLLMLEHRGRSSGLARQVCLEVVDRPRPGVLRVVSGLGPRAQWYRNLLVEPRCRVSSGRLRQVRATAYRVPQADAAVALERYAASHARAWRVLERTLRRHVPDGTTYEEVLPMVDLVLDPGWEQHGSGRR